MPIAHGTRFDRYQIISPIGTGGMGEIYLAQDVRLGRKVALKLLPSQYTQDQDRLRRFEQEAYAASALNHPNIITIYEIGQAEGRHFIATEFVEGSTLRRRLNASKLTINEALDIAIQVVSALAAAHAAGIVHRDIKPENIMIRPDGYVKVLDFGLAKLTEKAASTGIIDVQIDSGQIEPPAVQDVTLTETAPQPVVSNNEDIYATIPAAATNETTPGVVMGTAQYMSPEQARGLRVDLRTDIFSFGIVLYEMIAGRPPFMGNGSREIISSILNYEPLPLSYYQPDVPQVLEWVTAKALIKDRDERYQTTKEMLNDLKRLQHRIGIEHELSRSRPLTTSEELAIDQQARHLNKNTTQDFDAGMNSLSSGRVTEYFHNQFNLITQTKFGSSLLVAGAALLILAASFGIYQFIKLRSRAPVPFQRMQVSRFTTSGKATRAAISPDGKYVVYAQSDAGKQSLIVRQVTRSNNVEIVPPAEVIYRGLSFSHDGNFVYYVVQEQNNPIQMLYQVPVLGGVSRRLLVNIDSPITISPDNQKFAFVRRYRGQGEDALIIADIDGSNERILFSRKGPDFLGVSGAAWSPDGKIIACPAGTNTGGRQMYVAEIRVSDGQEKSLSAQRWANMGRVSWIRDGRGLVVSAMEQGSTLAQIWYIPYPKGMPRRITNDLNDYRDMSLTESSTALVTVLSESHVNVWLLPGHDSSRAKRITDGIGQYNGVLGLTWMPDDRLVYISRAAGGQDVWIMDQNGKNNIQLTTLETRADRYPTVSPDGRYIVFVSTRTGNSNLYRLDMQTLDQTQLTQGTSEEFPVISPDGKWVIYTATGSNNFTLWKVSMDGGEPIQLTDKLSQWPAVSPDGQQIACWYRAEPSARWQIALIPISGGDPQKVFNVPSTAETPIPMRWMPDGQGISFVDTRDGISNVWYQPLDGSAPRQLTHFASDQIFWFDWSRDGKQLACSRGSGTSDVVLISEFK
jgi:serine/threonine protein kinase/dipeptidyl aminopeptidase/acylaminoacyl peptidase